jgi:hypothetical protein
MLSAAVVLATFLAASAAHAWTWPIDGPVLRPYALGDDPYAGGQHRGLDIGGELGADVRTPAAGTVSFAGALPGGVRGVTVRTADGYAVTLLQLAGVTVDAGAAVAEGQVVGTIGESRDQVTTHPHVHLGIRLAVDEHGYVDPLSLLPPRGVPPPAPAPAPVEPTPAPAPAPVQPPAPPASVTELSVTQPSAATAPPQPPAAPDPQAVDEPGGEVAEVAEPSRTSSPAEEQQAPRPAARRDVQRPADRGEAAPPSGARAVPAADADAGAPVAAVSVPAVVPAVRDRAEVVPPVRTAARGPGASVLRPLPRQGARRPASSEASASAGSVSTPAAAPSRGLSLRDGTVLVTGASSAAPTPAERAADGERGAGTTLTLALAAAALLLVAAAVPSARRVRVRAHAPVGAEPARIMGADVDGAAEDPRCGRVAVCERAAPHRPRGGVRRSVGHLRALPPTAGQRRAHGQRDRRARYAGHGGRR